MPKTKKQLESSSSGSDSDGPEDRNPVKKAKTDEAGGSSSASGLRKDDKEPTWEIDRNRFVKVREFKGKVFIDIREFYDAGGELKPGKKGISLSASQWQKLKQVIPEVDEELKHI